MRFLFLGTTCLARKCSRKIPSQSGKCFFLLIIHFCNLSVDAAIYYRVMDPIASAIFITDPHLSTKQLAQSTLRNVLGTRTLTEIMCERESIALQAQEVLDEGTVNILKFHTRFY